MIFFAGCSPKLIPTERNVVTYLFDFREHSRQGFFISSTPYIGEFDPAGEITVDIYPAKKLKGVTTYMVSTDLTDRSYTEIKLIQETIEPQEILDIAVKEVKALGADGLVNFSMKDVDKEEYIKGTLRQQTITDFSFPSPSNWLRQQTEIIDFFMYSRMYTKVIKFTQFTDSLPNVI